MEGWEAIGWAWGIMKLFFAERGWDTLWETVAGLPFFHLLPPAHVGLKHPVPESGRLRSARSQGARNTVSSQCGREEEVLVGEREPTQNLLPPKMCT